MTCPCDQHEPRAEASSVLLSLAPRPTVGTVAVVAHGVNRRQDRRDDRRDDRGPRR